MHRVHTCDGLGRSRFLSRCPTLPNAKVNPFTRPAEWRPGPGRPSHPELSRVVAAWPDLPPHIRAAVLALAGGGRVIMSASSPCARVYHADHRDRSTAVRLLR